MDKYFVCLANSYKYGGRCIAGVEIGSDGDGGWEPIRDDDGSPRWIRPIARTLYGEIPSHEAAGIGILTMVRLVDAESCPNGAHVEDVHYGRMVKLDYDIALNPIVLNRFADRVHTDVFCSRERAVAADDVRKVGYSLMLVHPESACAYIDEDREKSKNRMKFTYRGSDYDFPITDPVFIDRLKRSPEGFLGLEDVYLTLSLGMAFEGWHYKLVAAVIVPPGREKEQDWFAEYDRELARLLEQKETLEGQIGEVRARLLRQMEERGVAMVQSDRFSVSYTPARTIVQFDSKAFKAENEALYTSYCKPRKREAAIVVKRRTGD